MSFNIVLLVDFNVMQKSLLVSEVLNLALRKKLQYLVIAEKYIILLDSHISLLKLFFLFLKERLERIRDGILRLPDLFKDLLLKTQKYDGS